MVQQSLGQNYLNCWMLNAVSNIVTRWQRKICCRSSFILLMINILSQPHAQLFLDFARIEDHSEALEVKPHIQPLPTFSIDTFVLQGLKITHSGLVLKYVFFTWWSQHTIFQYDGICQCFSIFHTWLPIDIPLPYP